MFIYLFLTASTFISHVASTADSRELSHDGGVIIHSGRKGKEHPFIKHLLRAKEFEGHLIEIVQK